MITFATSFVSCSAVNVSVWLFCAAEECSGLL